MTTSQMPTAAKNEESISFLLAPNALTSQISSKLEVKTQMIAIQKKYFWNKGANVVFVAMMPTPRNAARATTAKMMAMDQKCTIIGRRRMEPL